ncbi:Membrane-bound lytic murein transglycosylase D precursor [Thiorhodovibrio winogradskyi]|uniref:Membrane-bound lytic murein transglycosylase D n=1 Tax=Thiorhodovibrio winogradskyi TaxID=77007 RepID=A0ABZ0S9P7_9GAMM|nr:transglycosylase SLT domain-containing protein [Thiorhodovibrio winogradskyi]
MTATEHSAQEPLTGQALAAGRTGDPQLPDSTGRISKANSRSNTISMRVSALAIILPLALLGLGGCVSQPARDSAGAGQWMDQPPRSVSAREYGFVRPAIDPHSLAQHTPGRPARSGAPALSIAGDPWQRIRSGQRLGIAPHSRVTQSLKQFTRNKEYLNQLTARARPYLHLIVTELERGGLPTELALLPEIESRYNPRAVSHMSAAGMWQFMPYTGKEMGLVQNASYDARLDVLASTRGAVKYLRELNQTFDGDWALTLAAYNCGPACVQAAQRANHRAGKATDYWSLNLPRETEAYVPKLLAVVSMVHSPERFGQRLPALPAASPLAVVTTRAPVDLATAASASGVPARTLAELNPALKQGRNRAGQTTHLLVPAAAAARLNKHLRQLGGGTDDALAANEGKAGGRT